MGRTKELLEGMRDLNEIEIEYQEMVRCSRCETYDDDDFMHFSGCHALCEHCYDDLYI